MNIAEAKKLKVWAVVGATPKKEKFGNRIFHHLLEKGYEVYPIHPAATEIDGHTCYRSVRDLPTVPDIVDFVVGEEAGLQAVADCAAVGVRAVWLQPGADSRAVAEAAKAGGMEVICDCVLVSI